MRVLPAQAAQEVQQRGSRRPAAMPIGMCPYLSQHVPPGKGVAGLDWAQRMQQPATGGPLLRKASLSLKAWAGSTQLPRDIHMNASPLGCRLPGGWHPQEQ